MTHASPWRPNLNLARSSSSKALIAMEGLLNPSTSQTSLATNQGSPSISTVRTSCWPLPSSSREKKRTRQRVILCRIGACLLTVVPPVRRRLSTRRLPKPYRTLTENLPGELGGRSRLCLVRPKGGSSEWGDNSRRIPPHTGG